MDQNPMKALAGICVLIVLAVLAACLLGPPLTWFLDTIGQRVPEWHGIAGYPLDRVMTLMVGSAWTFLGGNVFLLCLLQDREPVSLHGHTLGMGLLHEG